MGECSECNFLMRIERTPLTKIDLVYLWCDGKEAEFKKQKAYWLKKAGKSFSDEAVSDGRFVQIDEMKYSLRSVQKYVPWINHIYIVTNQQVPAWLNLNHPKVSIVDHDEILPKEGRPSFNSQAIESCLYKIKGLSEHFLYANDDLFFNRFVPPSFFFANGNLPIVRMKKIKAQDDTLYGQGIFKSQKMIEEKFGKFFNYAMHHNVDAYLKSDYQKCAEFFLDEFSATAKHRFRCEEDTPRSLISYYMLATKRGKFKKVGVSLWAKILQKFGLAKIDSLYLNNMGKFKKIYTLNPALFCINDTEFSTNVHRVQAKQFLEQHFPVKSDFET